MEAKKSSDQSEEPNQYDFTYFTKFHLFLFTRKDNAISFLLRRKPKTGKFVDFRGKLNIDDDPAILFSTARKVYKKTAGLLGKDSLAYFLLENATSTEEPFDVTSVKVHDVNLQQPQRMENPVYQEWLGKIADTEFQYQFPSLNTVVYFVEIPLLNVAKLNEVSSAKGLGFEFLESTFEEVIAPGQTIAADLPVLLSHPGLNQYFKDYIAARKAIEITKTYGLLCCSPGTRHNKYQALFQSHLKKHGEKWKFYNIPDFAIPSDEDLKSFDAIIIPGSPCGIHNEYEWKQALIDLLYKIRYEYPAIKILGVCFGAQTVAHIFGGKVEKMNNEYLRGSEVVAVDRAFYELPYVKALDIKKDGELCIAESHNDHISKLPDDAIHLGSSKRTNVELFAIGDNILGLQGHPEYTPQWTATAIYNKNKETKDYKEYLEEVRKNLFKDQITHEDFLKIVFNFVKRLYIAEKDS